MKKNILHAINSILGSLLVLLGFTSCKTTSSSQSSSNEAPVIIENPPQKLLYGAPPAEYRYPGKAEPKKTLYGPPPSFYRETR